MGVLDKFIYELLPYTKKIDVKDELVIYDHEASKTKRVRVESLITDNDFDFPWDSEATYAKDSIVSFGGDLWESLQSSNLGNMPVEGVWWTKLNKVVGSTVVEYQPGVYGKGLVIVHYPYEGAIAAYAGVKLWELVVPEAQRPFHSSNIVAEIEAEEGGDPAPKWMPVHPVGGGSPGDLTAFVAKNTAGSDIVLTPSDASRWGSILSDGKAALIGFIDYIGSRLGQIGDRDVDASSRQDGRLLKYDALIGKYVHVDVEEGEKETPESIATKYESYEDVQRFTTAHKSKVENLTKATTPLAEAGTDDVAYMTALKVIESLAKRAGIGITWDNVNKQFNLGGTAENRGFYLGTYLNDPDLPDANNGWGVDINQKGSFTDSESVILNYEYDDLWDSGEAYKHSVGVDKFGVRLVTDNRFLIYLGRRHPGGATGFPDYSALIVDNRITKKGLEYHADYSAAMSPLSLINKGYVDTKVDGIISGEGNGTFLPVQDLTALKAINTTDGDVYKDKWLIHVEDAGLYRFDRDSTATDNGNSVIQPTVGVGRWLKLNSSITSHEMLTGVQGGNTGEHYHLTAAEYLIAAATELAFTHAIKAEIESKLSPEDLPSSDLVRDTVTVTAGGIDLTDIDIADIELTENTTIVSIEGMVEGSKMINLVPNGFTLDWSPSLINPLNVDGEADTEGDSLIMLLCSSTDPFRLKIKVESNPSPSVPKVNLILNHGNINTVGPSYSNLFYLSTSGAITSGLHNVDLTPSPVELEINPTFSISVANNKNAGLSGDEPNDMLKGVFLNNQTNFARTFDIKNLDDNKTYTIWMILCNDTAGAKTDISINGGTTQTFDTFELTTYQEIGSFSPVDGKITVGFAKNPTSTQDAYLCVTKIVEDD